MKITPKINGMINRLILSEKKDDLREFKANHVPTPEMRNIKSIRQPCVKKVSKSKIILWSEFLMFQL